MNGKLKCMLILWLCAILPGLICTEAAEKTVSFKDPPSVSVTNGKTVITFAVSESTDIEVSILNKEGKVVRHLAAGVIGGTNPAPAPLLKGLKQKIEWDGKDDNGKKAEQKGLTVRVSAGMKPAFDSFILDKPSATGAVTAVAVGPKGETYLWHRDCTANGNQGSNKLKVIDRNGEYLRTLMPYPANLPKEKAKVFGALIDEEGGLVPRVYNLQQLSLTDRGYFARGRTMASSGCVDTKGRTFWLMANARLAALEADGAPVYEHSLSKSLLPDFPAVKGWGSLAVSSDAKYLYMTGLAKGKNRYDNKAQVSSCVWRVDLASLKAEPFLGDPDKPGKEKGLLTTPNSVAAAKGLIYVSDPGADRIAVFKEADKSYAGEIKVKAPISIGVDSATGAVYASVRTIKKNADLVKFKDYSTDQEVCRVKLPQSYNAHRITVDSTAKPVRILLPTLRWQGSEINCYEDAGDKLVSRGDPRKDKSPWAPGPRDLTVDRSRGELYVKFGNQMYYRLEASTGKVLDTIKLRNVAGGSNANATQLIVAPDGSLITLSWRLGLRRLDRKGKPLNWEGRDTNAIPFGGIMTFQQRYMVIPNSKEIYVMLPAGYRTKKKAGGTCLNVLDTAGKTKRTLIWLCSQGAVPRVDPKGNIYIADMVKPKGRSYPEFFDGKMPPYKHNGAAIGGGRMTRDPENGVRFWTSSMYGSIIKFPPEGGIIWYGKDVCVDAEGKPSPKLLAKPKVTYGRHIGYNFKPVDVQGAEWVRFGYAPYGEARGAGFCMCEGVGFDVDPYGRVFYPNMGQFRIEMVDTNNNWIGSFGKYGNQDDGLHPSNPESGIRNPESNIPLAWPTYVALDDNYAYVNDTLSNRIVKVKLDYTVSKTCMVKSN